MASSKNSKTEKKTIAESSKSASKASKPRKEKYLEKKKKSHKKKKLSNCDVKEDKAIIVPSSSTESHEEEEEQPEEDKTEITNGRTSGTKPKNGKVKRMKNDDEGEGDGKEDAKSNVFPMNRIRTIIRGQGLDLRTSQEAIFVVNKATEKFLEQFTRDTYATCARDRKKSLAYKHLSSVVSKQSRYDFLSDFVPEKLKAEDALRERNSGVNGD